jgi:ferredoxin
MRIEVDYNVCADHGQCAITAPDIFQIDDEGHLVFEANPEDIFRSDAEDAAGACPERAITIFD